MAKARSVRECEVCGFPFKAKRRDALHCGPACRKRASRVAAGELTRKAAELLARIDRATKARRRVFGKS